MRVTARPHVMAGAILAAAGVPRSASKPDSSTNPSSVFRLKLVGAERHQPLGYRPRRLDAHRAGDESFRAVSGVERWHRRTAAPNRRSAGR